MIDEFFSNLLHPSFLQNIFQNDNWYLATQNFKKLLEESISDSIEVELDSSVSIKGKVQIGKDTIVGENVVIHGPVLIGSNAQIAPFTYIRPGTIIGNDCVIDAFAVIKNSLLMDGSKVADGAYVGDSILGAKARIGAGCVLSNRRFDQSEIKIHFRGNSISTGSDKFGAIIGEGARLGAGVITSPGSLVGKGTFISANIAITGFVPAGKFVKARTELELIDNKFEGEIHNKSKLYENS